jgi:MraZ protein
MFAGTYKHSLDAKNRIVIPAKHRAAIPDGDRDRGFYVSLWQLGETRCLSLFTKAAWRELMGRLETLAAQDEKAEAYLTKISASAEFVEADRGWRIVVPETLIKSSGLGAEVVLVGRNWQILVMNPADWERFDANLDRGYPDVYRDVMRVQAGAKTGA